MFKKRILALVTVVALLGGLVAACSTPAPAPAPSPTPSPAPTPAPTPAPAEPAKQIKWVVQSKNPTIQPVIQTAIESFKSIEAITDGGFVIEVNEPGSIVATDGEWDSVQSGTLDGAFTTPVNNKKAFGSVAGLFTEYAASPNPDQMAAWYIIGDGMALEQELIDNTPGYDMVMTLGPFAASGAEEELCTNKKLENVESLKGMKIRTFGDWGKILDEIGASVVGMPAGDVYEALQRGVLDACELSDRTTNMSFGIHEVTKYWYHPGIHAPLATFDFYVNKDAFNALPDSYKELLRVTQESALMRNIVLMPARNIEATKELKEVGVELLETPREIQLFLVEKAYEMWQAEAAEDPFFAKVYENQWEFVRGYASVYGEVQPDIPGLMAELGL
jgi:TRAP-type mannitol/chloroaromatic compound transport system substrate-binding protein